MPTTPLRSVLEAALSAARDGLVLACTAAVLGLAGPGAAGPPRPLTPAAGDVREAVKPAADFFGDPLPPGAVARLGTRRLCGAAQPSWVGFSPDGRTVAAQCYFTLSLWDAATGRLLLERKDYLRADNAIGWRADGTGVAVAWLPDRSYFVSAFTDANEKLPNPPRAQVDSVPLPMIHYLALSPDAMWVAVARNPGAKQFTIDLLPATPGRLLAALKPERTLGPFPGPCRDLRYAANGQLVTLHGEWAERGDWSLAVIDPKRNAVARTARIPAPGFCPWRFMFNLSADARLAAVPPRTKLDPNTYDGTVRIWDLAAGKELSSLPFSTNDYGTGHAFTPDGKRLITSTKETYFQVWDLMTGKEQVRLPTPEGWTKKEASVVTVSADGKRFATGRRDGRVDVWDITTGKLLTPLVTHRDFLDTVAVSQGGRLVATGAWDGSVRVWELETGKPVSALAAPRARDSAGPRGLQGRPAFTPDGRGLLFVAAGALALADPLTGKPLALPGGLSGRKGDVGGFAADGKTLATFTGDGVTLWDWPVGTARVTVIVPLGPGKAPGPKEPAEMMTVNTVSLSPDGRLLFTNSLRWRGGIGSQNANDVWEARTGKHMHRLTSPEPIFPRAAFAPDGRVMYLGGNSPGTVRPTDALTAWDPAVGKLLRRFDIRKLIEESPQAIRFGRAVNALAVSRDGRLLAVAEGRLGEGRLGMLDVWLYETASGRAVRKLVGHTRLVNDLAFSPDGRRLVSVSADQTGLVWDVTLPALAAAASEKPAGKGLSEAWDRLADPDPARGYAGIAALAAAPAEAVPLLRPRLRPAPVPTEADLDRLIGQLGAKTFAERTKALAELERFGPNAVLGVKARLARPPSAEVRARLVQFLDRHDGPEPSSYHLRCVRGVAALEAIGTADARALLAGLTRGSAADPLTREARAASRRLGSR